MKSESHKGRNKKLRFSGNRTQAVGFVFSRKLVGGLEADLFLVLVLGLVLLFKLTDQGLEDLEEGEDREAKEKAEVASDVRHQVVLGVDLKVGVDLDVKGKLEEELIFEGLKHFWLEKITF